MSNRIELNQPAPDFTLVDINGQGKPIFEWLKEQNQKLGSQ